MQLLTVKNMAILWRKRSKIPLRAIKVACIHNSCHKSNINVAGMKGYFMISAALVASMLMFYGVEPKDIEILTCIATKESSLDPSKVNTHNRNHTKDYGLFQINDVNIPMCNVSSLDLLDIHHNILCTIKVYKHQGLKAWSTLKLCKGKKYDLRNDSSKLGD